MSHKALQTLLLALADDEFIIGYGNSEWTGIAPVLEEDIAFSSLAQDEIGHARVYYEMAATLEGCSADQLAYGRLPTQFLNAQIAERPRGDWAYAVTRQFLYDTADYVRVESLTRSTFEPLAQTAANILREEKYHRMHAHTWLKRLSEGGAEAVRRQRAAFDALWPDALAIFEPLAEERALLSDGILAAPLATLCQHWLDQIAEPLRRYQLPFPFERDDAQWRPLIAPCYGGRYGLHSPDLADLYEQFTRVYRLDPQANW